MTGLVPEPSEPVDTASELRLVIEPGDLLCFSAAHVHAGVPNSAGVARFSVEVRTVDAGDVADDHGAPNVDGEAHRVAKDWFSTCGRWHTSDGGSGEGRKRVTGAGSNRPKLIESKYNDRGRLQIWKLQSVETISCSR